MLSPILLILIFIVGLLIGGVSIGGVLLLPGLKYLGGIPLHTAIPACMLSYMAVGLVGTGVFSRQGSIQWRGVWGVSIGALPGAYLGSFLLPFVSAILLETAIGLLIVISGLYALVSKRNSMDDETTLPDITTLAIIGFVVGVGSAVSGTGGPILLMPILIWFRVPVLVAIGLSLAIQIPISFTATIGNFIYGEIDFKLAATLAAIMALGCWIGAMTAHHLPIALLKRAVAILLVVVGIAMLARQLISF